jgi:hypothetical protein
VTGGFPRLRTVDVTFEDVPMSLGKNREKRGRRVGREAQMILQFDSMPDQYPAATLFPDGEKTICELNSKLELSKRGQGLTANVVGHRNDVYAT